MKFTKKCCVCSVTGRIPECECACHGSAAEKALAEIEQLWNRCSLGLAARWHTISESEEIIRWCGELFPKLSRMQRALEAVLNLPEAATKGTRDSQAYDALIDIGWNRALKSVRSAIEHELGPCAPEASKHE